MPAEQLTPAQIAQLRLAGMPADRPGMLGEYPRMMYKRGRADPNDHSHNLASDSVGGLTPLPIQGHRDIITRVVADADEELFAAEEGWQVSIDKALAKKAAA